VGTIVVTVSYRLRQNQATADVKLAVSWQQKVLLRNKTNGWRKRQPKNKDEPSLSKSTVLVTE